MAVADAAGLGSFAEGAEHDDDHEEHASGEEHAGEHGIILGAFPKSALSGRDDCLCIGVLSRWGEVWLGLGGRINGAALHNASPRGKNGNFGSVAQYHDGVDLSRPCQSEGPVNARIGRRHHVAARILRRWRVLSGGSVVDDARRRSVVACSGGADSVGLAVALAMVTPRPVIAHIVHDIRSAEEAEGDGRFVEQIAKQLGCDFVCESVCVAQALGNLEANARDARYAALERIAVQTGCSYVVTGHHAEDQAETVLMRLLRGAGVRGLGGIPERRVLGEAVVIRPMLGIRRAEIEGLCLDAGVGWRHDRTNDDLLFVRNRIRHTVIPMLTELRADAVDRIGTSAASCRDAAGVIDELVAEEMERWERVGDGIRCTREQGRAMDGVVFDGVLRAFVRQVGGGGLDGMSRRSVEAAHCAVVSGATDSTEHRVGPVVVEVTAHTIVVRLF